MAGDPVLTKLEALETSLKSEIKKEKRIVGIGIPLLVVAITVVGSYYTSTTQTELNNKLQKDVNEKVSAYQATLTAYIESQKHVQEEKAKFYRDVKSTLSLVDTLFDGLTHFVYNKRNDKLTQALASLLTLRTNSPFNTDPQLLEALRSYNDFVAKQWREFDTNPADNLRDKGFKDSQPLLKTARDALEKYLPPAPSSR